MERTTQFLFWAAVGLAAAGLFLVLLMFFVERAVPYRAEPPPAPPVETEPIPAPAPAETPLEPDATPNETETPLPEPEALVAAEVERFEAVYAEQRENLPAEVAEPVDENIGVIERAAADILAALANDPDNESLKRMLIATYRNELKMLRKALNLSGEDEAASEAE